MINFYSLGITEAKAKEIVKGKYQVFFKVEWFDMFRGLSKESFNELLTMIEHYNYSLEKLNASDSHAQIAFLSIFPYLEQTMEQYLSQSISQSNKAKKRWNEGEPDG